MEGMMDANQQERIEHKHVTTYLAGGSRQGLVGCVHMCVRLCVCVCMRVCDVAKNYHE